ncbi:hypothetical protein ABZS83_32910 [Streptomyces sp. NPDC005426]|uniref:hypothetical protein n=1 Tax=Streptomyces sp. NPDC005426 TaxID=3155344 RepID=UPI0033BD5B73
MPDAIVALVLVLVVGAALVLVSTYTRGHRAPTAGPDGDPTNAPWGGTVWAACGNPGCGGHNQTPHDVTRSGLTCRECGRGPQ